MTITFYFLLFFLKITKTKEYFIKKRAEIKLNIYFTIYTSIWLITIGFILAMYYISIVGLILSILILIWLITEVITNKTILIYGKNKEILQKQFMDVYPQ